MYLKCSLFSQLYFIFLIGLIQNPGFVYFPFYIYQDEETLQIPNTEKLELLKKNTDFHLLIFRHFTTRFVAGKKN